MTERDCLRNGDWKRINYYPVSVEKLQQASMREAAYLIAPVNIGEDYEYFDEVKHLLIIPEKPKTLEEIQKELDEKFDKLIEDTKTKFYGSKIYAESRYERNFDKIFDNFEYAKEHGQFPEKPKWVMTNTLSANSNITSTFVIKQGKKHEGYYTIGNGYLRFYMPYKPNAITRWFVDKLFSIRWVDEVSK
jgi:hypothetical protein